MKRLEVPYSYAAYGGFKLFSQDVAVVISFSQNDIISTDFSVYQFATRS